MKKAVKVIGITILALLTLGILSIVAGNRYGTPVAQVQNQPVVAKLPEAAPITPDTLFIEINKVRVKNSLQPFSHNALLDKSSTLKCDDMVKYNYWAHDNPVTGKKGGTFMRDIPGLYYDNGSENLGLGWYNRPEQVIDAWMDSPAHAASIVDPQYTEIGFAVCTKKSESASMADQIMVVQHKINPYEQKRTAPSTNSSTGICHYYPATSGLPASSICN